MVFVKVMYENELRRVEGGVRAEEDTPGSMPPDARTNRWEAYATGGWAFAEDTPRGELVIYNSENGVCGRMKLDKVEDGWLAPSDQDASSSSIDQT